MRQSILYVAVGVVVYALDLATFTAVILAAPDAYVIGNVLGKLVGAATGFLLHKFVTFSGDQADPMHRQAVTYGLLLMSNIVLGSMALYVFVDVLALPKLPARIGIDAVIILTAFVVSRHVVFRGRP